MPPAELPAAAAAVLTVLGALLLVLRARALGGVVLAIALVLVATAFGISAAEALRVVRP